jgi:hypothetical protein
MRSNPIEANAAFSKPPRPSVDWPQASQLAPPDRYLQAQVLQDLQHTMVFIGGPRQVGKRRWRAGGCLHPNMS